MHRSLFCPCTPHAPPCASHFSFVFFARMLRPDPIT
ncbi:hypothetical protein NC651_026077 [Populus alba x Populus x berolinensis]|nr:hypothetical protein NC651_026077 [Populus alba x Populus x berolinensis]